MPETQTPAPKDELLLQASDAPEIPAVLLIDLSSIAHPIYHMSQAEPDPDHTSQRTAAVVRSLAANHPHAAICCDSRSNFRKELDSTYKANRPASEAPLHHQIDLAKEALAADGFPVYEVDGFEGDDLIATATARITGHSSVSVLIASADKDLLALVSDQVEVHSTRTGKRVGPDEVKAKLGVGPGLVVDYLTLVGDASDNIKGAKGIGPKTAAEILGFFGNLDQVYSAIDAGSASSLKPAQRASLDELRPRLDGVRSLVRMREDVPLDIEAVFKPRVPKVVEAFMEEDEMETEAKDGVQLMDEALQLAKVTEAEKGTPPPDEVQPATSYPLVEQPAPSPRIPDGTSLNQKPRTEAQHAALAREIEMENEVNEPTQETAEAYSYTAGESPWATGVRDSAKDIVLGPKPADQPAAAVAVIEQPAPDEWERGLDPRTMHEACLLAKRLHQSHMFDGYGSPQAVLSTVMLGRELGLSSMASLRSVHIIKGKHSLSADLMVALVLKSGLAEYFTLIETTDELCTFETKRKGNPKPQRLTYGMEQATQAGLDAPPRPGKEPSPWHTMPRVMLRARCKSELARLEYPDLLAGLYTPEELRDAKVNGA